MPDKMIAALIAARALILQDEPDAEVREEAAKFEEREFEDDWNTKADYGYANVCYDQVKRWEKAQPVLQQIDAALGALGRPSSAVAAEGPGRPRRAGPPRGPPPRRRPPGRGWRGLAGARPARRTETTYPLGRCG